MSPATAKTAAPAPAPAAAPQPAATGIYPPGSIESLELATLRTLAHLEHKVDTLTRDFRAHLEDDARVQRDRKQRDLLLQKMADGQGVILQQLADMRRTQDQQAEELKRNTDITRHIAEAGQAFGAVRRAFLWIAPIVVLVLGIVVGILQYRAASGGISP